MKPSPTDIDSLPRHRPNLLPLTGLSIGHVQTLYTLAHRRLPSAPGRPWALPLAARVLLVLIHLHTNLTTRALAAPFTTSQSTVDRILHHRVPALGQTLRPTPDSSHHP